jgi:hypothetical protein
MKQTFIFLFLLLSVTLGFSQPISPYLTGQNAWLLDRNGGRLASLWQTVKKSNVHMVRVGGNGPNVDVLSNDQYIALIDSIRAIGAEPMIQVAEGRGKYTAAQAADVVDYINNVMGRNIKYWIIGNEPNLGTGAIDAPGVAAYMKGFATAMKLKDPSILIVGPECAYYDNNYYPRLVGGDLDITGKDANGNYYVDIISFHTYPFGGTQTRTNVLTSSQSLAANADALIALMNSANTKNGRTGERALQWALTEFNIDYLNPAQNTVEGVGVHSFLNGQYWAEVFMVGMQKQSVSMQPWSIYEGGGARGGGDLSYLDGADDNIKPRSAYYHEMLIGENFRGTYLPATNNQSLVTAFGSRHDQTISVMLLNKSQTTAYPFTLQLSNKTITASSPLAINLMADIDASYQDKLDPQSTVVLLFDTQGKLTKKIVYSLPHAVKTLPPTYLNPGENITLSSFSADRTSPCINTESSTFTAAVIGDYQNLTWNFGAGATPQTATGFGPISVTYATAGTKTVSLSYQSGGNTVVDTKENFIQARSCIREAFRLPIPVIPGKVEAVEFDKGGEGVAYHDSDVINQGAARDPNVPRADESVDTELGTGIGNIGYTADGEWLRYFVNISKTGNYKVTLRVASLNGGGSLKLSVNDVDKTGVVAVPATGGFGTYQDLVIPNVSLEANANTTLKLDIVKSGFNVAAITFAETTAPQPEPALSIPVVVNRVYNGSDDSDGRSDAVELLIIKDHLDLRNLIIKDFDVNATTDNGGKYQFSNSAFWQDLRSGTAIVLRRKPTVLNPQYVQDLDEADFTLDLSLDDAAYFTNLSGNSVFNITSAEMIMVKSGTAAGVAGSIHALITRGTSTALTQSVTSPKLEAPVAANPGARTFNYPTSPTKTINDYAGVKLAVSNSTSLNWGNGFGANNVAYIESLRDATLPAPGNLTASVINSNAITLNWVDNATDESGFEVLRSTDGSTFTSLTIVADNTTSYTDRCLDYDKTYSYKVRTRAGQLRSRTEATAQAKTDGVPVVTLPDLKGDCLVQAQAPVTIGYCGETVTATTNNPTSFSAQGTYSINWTFALGNGATSTAVQQVTVKDETAPVALVKNATITLKNGTASLSVEQIDNGSSDACGPITLTLGKTTFDCSNLGTNLVSLTVADAYGNQTIATATVAVVGTIPAPSILVSRTDNTNTGLDGNTIALGYGAQQLTLTAGNAPAGTTYAWSGAAGLSSGVGASVRFSPNAAGSYPIELKAINEYGCSATMTQTITVIDVRCGNKNDKVLVCHNGSGEALCISANAVDAHLKHGDKLGTCSTGSSARTSAEIASGDVNKLTIQVGPNPTSDRLTVTIQVPRPTGIVMEIRNLQGTLLYSRQLVPSGTHLMEEISLQAYAEGTYLLNVQTSTERQAIKVIRSR